MTTRVDRILLRNIRSWVSLGDWILLGSILLLLGGLFVANQLALRDSIDFFLKAIGIWGGLKFIHYQHTLSRRRAAEDLLRGYIYRRRAEAIDRIYSALQNVVYLRETILDVGVQTKDNPKYSPEFVTEINGAFKELSEAINVNGIHLPNSIRELCKELIHEIMVGKMSATRVSDPQTQRYPDRIEQWQTMYEQSLVNMSLLSGQLESALRKLLLSVSLSPKG